MEMIELPGDLNTIRNKTPPISKRSRLLFWCREKVISMVKALYKAAKSPNEMIVTMIILHRCYEISHEDTKTQRKEMIFGPLSRREGFIADKSGDA